MSHEFLLCMYIAALIAQIILLFRAWKSARVLPWIGLYVFEVSSAVASFSIMHYYNEHPGYMLSTMGHVLWSMGAAGVFCVMVLLSIIFHMLRVMVFK